MLANVGRGTSPELALRAALRAAGARGYRLNLRTEGIRPDLVFTKRKVAVFVHGCFWHRCPTCRYALPRAHRDFWVAKFRRNRQRDRQKRRTLEAAGWRVLELWEHELRDAPARVVRRVTSLLR
jgi:DNA mismatch endonuclease (patch repair protein)